MRDIGSRRAAAGLVCIALVALGGCGDDDGDDASDTGSAVETEAPDSSVPAESPASTAASEPDTTAAGGSETTTAPQATDAPSSTPAGPPTGEPVVIGATLAETGIGNLKAIGDGMAAFVAYANTDGGGLAGRPIELERCDTENDPQKATDCVRSFADNSAMVAAMGSGRNGDVLSSTLAAAADPMVYLCPGVSHPAEGTAPNAFCLYAGSPMGFFSSMVYMKDELGLTTGHYVTVDSPAGHATGDLLKSLASEIGVTITDAYFPPDQADFLPVAQAAIDSGAEYLLPAGGVPGMLAMAQSLTTLGNTLPIGTWSALMPTSSLEQLTAANFPIVTDAALPDAGDSDDPEVVLYREWMESEGYGDEIGDSSLQGWMAGRALQIAAGQLVESGDELNRANLLELMRTGTFDVPLFASSLSIDNAPTTPGFSSVANPSVNVAVATAGDRDILDLVVTLP